MLCATTNKVILQFMLTLLEQSSLESTADALQT